MVRISDVAAEAGVSVATVSRALNGLPSVHPELAERVRDAAVRLGSRPNAVARGLRTQKTEVLALIISDIENPVFTAIARGVEDVAQRNGYSVILCNSDEDPEKEARYLDVAIAEQVAGLILSPHSSATDVRSVRAAGIPLIVVDRPLDEDVDAVLAESGSGAEAATRHLLAEGWMHPACITGPDDAATALDRLAGYRSAMIEAGATPRFEHAPFSREGGRAAAASVLDSTPSVDALFVANAALALGVLAELRSRGLVPGRDVGLVTFDDAPWTPFIDPPMTVVSQPAYEIGSVAAELLMTRISGSDQPVHRTSMPTSLVVRASSLRGR